MKKVARYLMITVTAVVIMSTFFVKAQDATQQPKPSGTIVCDSDLMLSLYTAEHFFSFDQIVGMMQRPDPALVADVSTLDRGQYTPFVTALTNMPIVSMSQEQIQNFVSMMNMDDATLQAQVASMVSPGTDMSTFTVLNPASIAGEDPTCTTLRKELNRFYTILNVNYLQSANSTGTTGTTGAAPATGNGSATTTTTPASAIGGSNSTGSSENGNGGASNPGGNTSGTGAQNTPPPGGGSPGG